MKKRILCKKIILQFVFALILGFIGMENSKAAAGFFGQGSGGGLISYTANGGSQINSYNWNSNIGVLYSLTLNGGIIHTFKDGSGNVCGGTMYWRVYKVGNTPGSFNTVSLGYNTNGPFSTTATPSDVSTSNGNDQKWLNAGAGVNIFNDANISSEVGSCRFDVYFEFTGNTSSNSGCGTTVSLGSSGSPLQISFTKSRVSANSGAFNTASNWSPNGIPSNNENIAISGTHSITLDGNYTAASITFISTGTFTVNISQTLQIAGGVTGSGTFNVNGSLQINSGGFTNIAPTYGSSSTLIYNSGTTYGRGTEWSATTGAGYPNHIQINSGTTLNLGANSGTGTARQCAGNLTINSGGTLSMNETGAVMTAALTVRGNFTNNGTITLSGSVGGDLVLFGNLDDNGTFTANTRAIFFDGSNTQTINSTTDPLDIDVMRVQKTGGEIIIGTNLVVDETNDPFQVSTAASVINLNGKDLTIGKSGSNSAISMFSGSSIKCNTASSITIAGNGNLGTLRFDPSNNTLRNLTIVAGTSRTVTLGNALNIVGGSTFGVVTVGSGSTLNTSNFLTLKSDANGTACIGNSAGTISGNVTAERYIPALGVRGRFRFLASPVAGRTIADWMNNFYITGPGTGTTLGAANSNGWHTSNANIINAIVTATSVLTYNEAPITGDLNTGWTNVATNTPLTPGLGFRAFLRGTNNGTPTNSTYTPQIGANANSQTQAAFTIALSGAITNTVNAGTVTLPATFTTSGTPANDGWNLVGNPYPSTIDWNASSGWTKTNIGGTIWIYNPSNNSYGNWDGLTATNSVTRYISSGQAFFVKASASPTFSCTEEVKVSLAGSRIFKSAEINTLRIGLVKDESNKDETVIRFMEGKNNEFNEDDDVTKYYNPTVNVSSYFGADKYASVNYLKNELIDDKIIPISAWVDEEGSYKLNFTGMSDFTLTKNIFLKDKFLNTITNIEINPSVDFVITSDSNSKGDNRFEIIFAAKGSTNTKDDFLKISSNNLSIYPNPATDELNINISNANFKNSEVVVYNISGTEILKTNMAANNAQLNIETLSNGVYFVKVTNQNGFNKTVKFVK